jgi:hypothetical protein
MQPVDASFPGWLAHILWNLHRLPVIEDQDVLVDMEALTFHRVARDAADGLAVWHGTLRHDT